MGIDWSITQVDGELLHYYAYEETLDPRSPKGKYSEPLGRFPFEHIEILDEMVETSDLTELLGVNFDFADGIGEKYYDDLEGLLKEIESLEKDPLWYKLTPPDTRFYATLGEFMDILEQKTKFVLQQRKDGVNLCFQMN